MLSILIVFDFSYGQIIQRFDRVGRLGSKAYYYKSSKVLVLDEDHKVFDKLVTATVFFLHEYITNSLICNKEEVIENATP